MMMQQRSNGMRWRLVFGLCAVLSCRAVLAQVGIWVETDQKHYLRYEPIEVTVTLRNYSGNTLVFGGGDGATKGSLHFLVRQAEGMDLKPFDPGFNPAEDLILGAGETRRLTVALNTIYAMQREGTYHVQAQISHTRLPDDHRSESLSLNVREGLPVVERRVGLPSASAAQTITTIKVTLLLFNDGEKGLYCLRAEDDTAVYGTVRLGPQIIGSQPQMDADAASDIHVLIQMAPRLHVYAVYSLSRSGMTLRQKQFYKPDEYGPRLTRAPGYLKIVGGVPAQENVDFNVAP